MNLAKLRERKYNFYKNGTLMESVEYDCYTWVSSVEGNIAKTTAIELIISFLSNADKVETVDGEVNFYRFTNYLKREGYNRLDLLQACDAFFDKYTNVQHLRDIIYKVIDGVVNLLNIDEQLVYNTRRAWLFGVSVEEIAHCIKNYAHETGYESNLDELDDFWKEAINELPNELLIELSGYTNNVFLHDHISTLKVPA